MGFANDADINNEDSTLRDGIGESLDSECGW